MSMITNQEYLQQKNVLYVPGNHECSFKQNCKTPLMVISLVFDSNLGMDKIELPGEFIVYSNKSFLSCEFI